MRTAFHATAVMLCALLAPAVLPVGAQDHAGHRAPPAAATPAKPTPGKRWATDAPLRKGMAEIRAAVDAFGHYEHGQPGPAQATTLATTVDTQVAYLVANCKLEPQADAALHGIIARLLQGTAALKANPQDMAALDTLRQALQDYARQFDDPVWATTEPEER